MDDFMKDRHGVDELTTVLGVTGMLFALVGSLLHSKPLMWISIVVVLVALARAFSKNLPARRKENDSFKTIAVKIPGVRNLVSRLNTNGMYNEAGKTHGASSSRADAQARKEELERNKRLAKRMWKERKTTSFIKCPVCGQILSVPKGKGKIRVTCPKCHTKMEAKS